MRILLFFSSLLLGGTLAAQSPADTASIGARIDSIYLNIAHVFSRYETKLNGAFLARGTNSIQLLRRDDSWEITSIIWSDEPKQ